MAKAKVYIINNNKGGIGKSETARELAAMFALDGKKTLIIDTDHQANISIGFNINPDNLVYDLYDVLLDRLPTEKAIKSSGIKFNTGGSIDILPSNDDMASFELDAIKGFHGEEQDWYAKNYRHLYLIFRSTLNHLQDEYDVIVVDTPPAMGVIFANAMLAFDNAEVIIPFKPDKYSYRSLTKVIEVIKEEFMPKNPTLKIRGVIITFYNKKAKINKRALGLLNEYATKHDIHIYDSKIRFIQRFEDELSDKGIPAVLYKKGGELSKMADDYFALKEEMKL